MPLSNNWQTYFFIFSSFTPCNSQEWQLAITCDYSAGIPQVLGYFRHVVRKTWCVSLTIVSNFNRNMFEVSRMFFNAWIGAMHESVQCITLSQGTSKWSDLIALLEGSHFQQKISRNCSLEALTNSVMLISRLCLWKSNSLVSSPLTLAHFPSCPLQDLERSSTVSPTQTLSIRTSFSGSEVSFGGPSWCFGRGGTQQYSATRRAPAEVGLELPNDICAAAQWDSICFQSTKWCCDAAPPVSTKTLINTRARLTFGEIQYYDAYTACTYIKHIYIYYIHTHVKPKSWNPINKSWSLKATKVQFAKSTTVLASKNLHKSQRFL